MVTLHEVITFLVSMQISISSLQTHNVNRCGRDRKSGSAGMPRPISYAVFCLKKKNRVEAVREDMAKYFETDLLFYHAVHPEALVARESAHCYPMLFWSSDTL